MLRDVFRAIDSAHNGRLIQTQAGLAANWSGGWIRAMELPDGRVIVGAVCEGDEAAIEAVNSPIRDTKVKDCTTR